MTENEQEWIDLVGKIVKAGATPIIVCNCGMVGWYYEGSVKGIMQRERKGCPRCESTLLEDRKLLADFNAPEL